MKILKSTQNRMEVLLDGDELAVICNCMAQAYHAIDNAHFQMKVGMNRNEFRLILDEFSDLIPAPEC